MLEVRGVSVVLGGRPVLHEVTFSAAPGDFVALLGPNGAGKTTLVRALYRSVRGAGEVSFGGASLYALAPRELARKVAVLRQEPELAFDFRVRELVAMGRSPHRGRLDPEGPADRDAVARAMALTGVEDLGARSFRALSGGEKQRVLLARAIAQAPELLLLDEPTSHLDLEHQLSVLARVKALGLTVVAALHDPNLALRFATRVVLLEAGRVVAEGPPEEVLVPERLEALFHVRVDRVASRFGPRLAFAERAP